MRKAVPIAALAAAALLVSSLLWFFGGDSQDGPTSGPGDGARDRVVVAAPAGTQVSQGKTAARPGAVLLADAEVETGRHEILEHVFEEWRGDLDGMIERGFVRILTVHNPLFFSYDGVHQRGLTHELARAFEKHLAKAHKAPRGRLNIVLIPLARDELLPHLISGKGDIVAANLTITPARRKLVDFSDPIYPNVRELVITGPGAPDIASLDDLTATEIHVRRSSSYFEHLSAINETRRADGQKEIPVVAADELLEDYDLLEMVNAGLVPAIVVDSHKAALWAQVFDGITVHEDLAVNEGGSIAWAIRKDSPLLMKAVNDFVRKAKKGTLLGNILIKRYLKSADWIDNVRAGKARERYEAVTALIRTYAGRFDFDWQMIMAQGYQESKLNQNTRSKAGAVGIMQVLPTTAADPNVGVPNIEDPESNVHAGVKYLRFLRDRYFSDPEIAPLDQVLFSLAAYNAGPANIARARKRARKMGLDPNRWFGETEVATAKAVSREPVVYVRNIYKYFIAYKQIAGIERARANANGSQE